MNKDVQTHLMDHVAMSNDSPHLLAQRQVLLLCILTDKLRMLHDSPKHNLCFRDTTCVAVQSHNLLAASMCCSLKFLQTGA